MAGPSNTTWRRPCIGPGGPRQRYVEQLTAALSGRRVVWFGTRGCDATPLLGLPGFRAVVSMISPLDDWPDLEGGCLETFSGRRVDLDAYSVDEDTSEAARQLHDALWTLTDDPCVLVPYRPALILNAVVHPRENRVRLAGLVSERQKPFEHKVWVESTLRRTADSSSPYGFLPWYCFAIEPAARPFLRELLDRHERIVIRLNHSNGGNGFALIESREAIDSIWGRLCRYREGYCSVAPYLVNTIPLSVNGCVFPDNTVRLFTPSVQIVGDPTLTHSPFAYCGNDFARVKDIGTEMLTTLEALGTFVGRWLGHERYVGAFGVDALIHEDRLLFVEVNPRFQGSSMVGASLSEQSGQVDIYLAHLGAFLGLQPPEHVPLPELARDQSSVCTVVLRNLSGQLVPSPVGLDDGHDLGGVLSMLPATHTLLAPNAIVCRLRAERSMVGLDGRLLPGEQERVGTLLTLLDA